MLDEKMLRRTTELAADDGEFTLRAQGWTGTVRVREGDESWLLPIDDGHVAAPITDDRRDAQTVLAATDDVWAQVLAAVPPPGFSDPWSAVWGGFELVTGPITADRHGAIRRLVELMRHAANDTDPTPVPQPAVHRHGEHDAAVGRYVHVDLDGVDHRVYYEEAGSGIPILCQHTAGADGRQWRHLLEDERVTSRFRVIAYDLPHHGKSVPPESVAWWAQPYRLTTQRAMAVPNVLAEVLGLDRPVFLGSSIGGMLALDLARFHPDRYRAVVSVEGGLKVPISRVPDSDGLAAARAADDPANHAELMTMVMAATAPEAYRQETRLHYAQGAPGVFPGDIYFYGIDHDLSNEAEQIDTVRCPVYMLTGVYDFPTVPLSQEAAARIPNAELQLMEGLGHFPMSEDPVRFAEYLLPVLERITAQG
jgi:pimeloyl-ACP methyl ester carboxylesterase